MIEDGHPHVILAHPGTLSLRLHAMQDLHPKTVTIPPLPNKGIIQGMELSKSLFNFIYLPMCNALFQSLGVNLTCLVG